jgi:hypothetical protein
MIKKIGAGLVCSCILVDNKIYLMGILNEKFMFKKITLIKYFSDILDF